MYSTRLSHALHTGRFGFGFRAPHRARETESESKENLRFKLSILQNACSVFAVCLSAENLF